MNRIFCLYLLFSILFAAGGFVFADGSAPSLADQKMDAQQKRREIAHRQAALFREAVDCYKHKKYAQAGILFGQLAAQHDPRGEVWLKKVDRTISVEMLKARKDDQKRQLQRQKEMTEELDLQKRLFEKGRLPQKTPLNPQLEAVHKQLEDSVDVMYQEAVRLYNQGQFTAAADKFKDVDGILPGYKRTSQYMDEAQKEIGSAPQKDAVSKALDLFDPHVQ